MAGEKAGVPFRRHMTLDLCFKAAGVAEIRNSIKLNGSEVAVSCNYPEPSQAFEDAFEIPVILFQSQNVKRLANVKL